MMIRMLVFFSQAMLAYKSIDDSEGKIPYIEISDIKYETFMVREHMENNVNH